jgi:hypothetical protein
MGFPREWPPPGPARTISWWLPGIDVVLEGRAEHATDGSTRLSSATG